MDESRLELKVGALALGAVVIAGALVAVLGGLSTGRTFTFHADFAYAGGLPPGAVVKIAGVKVGRVREVQFRPGARDDKGRVVPVRLRIDIDATTATALRADTTCTVGSQGALGESFLEVLPGDAADALAEGAAVRGLDPPRLDVLLARLFSVFEDAANDEAFRNFLVQVASLAGSVDRVVDAHRAEIGSLFTDLAATLADGRAAMRDVRTAAQAGAVLLGEDELGRVVRDVGETVRVAKAELPVLAADARALMTRLDTLAGSVGPEELARLKATVARLDTAGAQVQKIVGSIEAIVAKIERGEGTLGGFVKDPQAYQDLRALLADLKANPWKFLWKP